MSNSENYLKFEKQGAKMAYLQEVIHTYNSSAQTQNQSNFRKKVETVIRETLGKRLKIKGKNWIAFKTKLKNKFAQLSTRELMQEARELDIAYSKEDVENLFKTWTKQYSIQRNISKKRRRLAATN